MKLGEGTPEAVFPPAEPPVPSGDDASLKLLSGAIDPWLIWQLADSAFPTGGFAHSGGLEAAWQQGEIRSPEELVQFIQAQLGQTGRSALPFVNEAYHQKQPFEQLDRYCDCFLSNHVANRGSRAQGQAFLLTVAQTCGAPSLEQFRETVLHDKLPGHLAPIFGNSLRLLGVPHSSCLRLYLFTSLRSMVASAVRLGIVGPMAAQKMQMLISPDAETIADRCANFGVAEAAQTVPPIDVLQGAHDRLYSRLFQT
jgi:urease accessory protein